MGQLHSPGARPPRGQWPTPLSPCTRVCVCVCLLKLGCGLQTTHLVVWRIQRLPTPPVCSAAVLQWTSPSRRSSTGAAVLLHGSSWSTWCRPFQPLPPSLPMIRAPMGHGADTQAGCQSCADHSKPTPWCRVQTRNKMLTTGCPSNSAEQANPAIHVDTTRLLDCSLYRLYFLLLLWQLLAMRCAICSRQKCFKVTVHVPAQLSCTHSVDVFA